MPQEIRISGEGCAVTLQVHGREVSDPEDACDANWLACDVSITAGQFKGNYVASFRSEDFVGFEAGLRAVLDGRGGTASFRTDEEALSLDLQVGRTGVVRIAGVAQVPGPPEVMLSFSFDSDITLVQATAKALRHVIVEYPVVK